MRVVQFVVVVIALLASSVTMYGVDVAKVLKESGIKGGLVVHLDCQDGSVAAEFGKNKTLTVQALAKDVSNVARARANIKSKGLYGRVSVDQYDGKNLPYIDNVVNLIVADSSSVSQKEIMRVVAPLGVAVINGKKTVKKWPSNINEWTHYLNKANNNAVAEDPQSAPPRNMQYLSGPLWTRHHDKLASIDTVVTAKGRIFYILDEGPVYAPFDPPQWSVIARDAFNGLLLWKAPISKWADIKRRFRSGPVQLQRLMVTDGDRVFVTLGLNEPISVLDAATGEIIRKLDITAKAEEFILQNGTLVVQVGEHGAEQALLEGKIPGTYITDKYLIAVNPDSGKTMWRWPADKTTEIVPQTLAAEADKVFLQDGKSTVCLDLKSGKEVWRNATFGATKVAKSPSSLKAPKLAAKNGKKNKRKKKKGGARRPGWDYATLVVKDGVVLSCYGNKLQALDAKSGKEMWDCPAKTPFSKTPSVDILVISGKVWISPTFAEGRDLKTGKVVSTNKLQDELVTSGHHHRCYRDKGAGKYIIQGYRGLEYRDTEGEENSRNNWIRGLCQYGVMPANGLIYAPPHNCGCYPEALLYGFWALKNKESGLDDDNIKIGGKLIKGASYGQVADSKIASGDPGSWPLYRHDPERTGITDSELSVELNETWKFKADGKVTPPVISKGTVIISSVETHEIIAIDEQTGKKKWSFIAGGDVDSTPTIAGDAVVFGAADGSVYCLKLADGSLVWKFVAAPMDKRTIALGQIESLWPVHGSVLVKNDVAYFVAGRSTYIDGGMFMFGLDVKTGAVKYSNHLKIGPSGSLKNTFGIEKKKFSQNAVDYKTYKASDKSDAFSMRGNISDIMVATKDAVYLRHMKFDDELNAKKEFTYHLFSTSRLIDDNEAHRSHWFYGKGDFRELPVAYEWLTRGSYGGFKSPVAKLMLLDGNTIYGTNVKKGDGYVLYKADVTDIDSQFKKDFPALKDKKATLGKQIAIQGEMTFHPRALVKAGNNLVVAGYAKKDSSFGEIIDRSKGLLQQVSTDGKIISDSKLSTPPVFDGMAVAGKKLFISCVDGSVICLK